MLFTNTWMILCEAIAATERSLSYCVAPFLCQLVFHKCFLLFCFLHVFCPRMNSRLEDIRCCFLKTGYISELVFLKPYHFLYFKTFFFIRLERKRFSSAVKNIKLGLKDLLHTCDIGARFLFTSCFFFVAFFRLRYRVEADVRVHTEKGLYVFFNVFVVSVFSWRSLRHCGIITVHIQDTRLYL